jgi:hypothetical protein
MNFEQRRDLVTSVVLDWWTHMKSCQCSKCIAGRQKMSANLDELEAQQAPEKKELDKAMKAEMEKFINRYCFGYQHTIALKALEELIIQARTHR